VVWRRLAYSIPSFPQVNQSFSASFDSRQLHQSKLVRAKSLGQLSFSSTFVVEIHSMTSLRLRPTGLVWSLAYRRRDQLRRMPSMRPTSRRPARCD
jgi:hypothetical protein